MRACSALCCTALLWSRPAFPFHLHQGSVPAATTAAGRPFLSQHPGRLFGQPPSTQQTNAMPNLSRRGIMTVGCFAPCLDPSCARAPPPGQATQQVGIPHCIDSGCSIYRCIESFVTPALRATSARLFAFVTRLTFPSFGTTPGSLPSSTFTPIDDRSRLRCLAVAADFGYQFCGTIAPLRQRVRALCTPLLNSDLAKSPSNVIRSQPSALLQPCRTVHCPSHG